MERARAKLEEEERSLAEVDAEFQGVKLMIEAHEEEER